MTVQEIRPGYKQTEVGVIPEDWQASPLGKLCNFKTGPFGSALHKSDYTKGGIPLVNPMHIAGGAILPTDDMTVTAEAAQALSDFLLRKGDIVIGRRGDMGRCAVVGNVEDGWLCGTGSMIVRPGLGADAAFFQRVLSSPAVIGKITENSVGSTMVNLNQTTLRGLVVQEPPLPEQRAIAAALADADGLIAALEGMIAKKRDLKQAAMQHLLTGKTRLPGFSGKWEPRSLGSISAFITKGATPTTYGFGWQSHGVLFLRSECVSDQGLDLSQSMFIADEAHRVLKRGEVRSGDLLITITGNVGRVIRLADDFGVANINQHIARIRITSEDVDGSYVYHQLSHPKYLKYFNSIVTGQAYPQISLKQVREAIVLFPSVKEQTAIAEVLSDMDADLAALDAQAAKARAVKQGMMQELLTGRVRLV